MRYHEKRLQHSAAPAIFLGMLALSVTGCGGGGGQTGGPTPLGGSNLTSPATVTGTVDFANATPAPGYTVTVGSGAHVYSALTAVNGTFSIVYDASQLSGTQPLAIYDTNRLLLDNETVTLSGNTVISTAFVVGPPAPPV